MITSSGKKHEHKSWVVRDGYCYCYVCSSPINSDGLSIKALVEAIGLPYKGIQSSYGLGDSLVLFDDFRGSTRAVPIVSCTFERILEKL